MILSGRRYFAVESAERGEDVPNKDIKRKKPEGQKPPKMRPLEPQYRKDGVVKREPPRHLDRRGQDSMAQKYVIGPRGRAIARPGFEPKHSRERKVFRGPLGFLQG